jgi:FtsP/CotA-like multicopper oxidase with cupredoxin domain
MLASAAIGCLAGLAQAQIDEQEPLSGSDVPQFVDPLPLLSVAGGPIDTIVAGNDEIEVHMREFQAYMMPSTFVPASGSYTGTWVWGYIAGSSAPSMALETYTGPVVVATRNVPTQVRFVNDLGYSSATNVLAWRNATDQTLHWADPLNDEANMCAHDLMPDMPPEPPCDEHYDGPIPAVVHLHGGDVPPVLDGGPDAWYTSDGLYQGHAYYTRPGVSVAGNEAVYRYPNGQEAAPVWFHDHALGLTRLNVYAGLAGAYDIIDPDLQLPTGLHPVGLQQGSDGPVEFIIPLVIQDRMFDVNGQLYFPNEGDNPEHPYWVPEFLGDVIVVNGKVWPYLEVQARRYRFLIINGSNARAYELFTAPFSVAGTPRSGSMGTNDEVPEPLARVAPVGPPIWQIGTDGGYLDEPVSIDASLKQKLVILPGERADIIIDFAGFDGQTLVLRNSGRTPYPKGEPPHASTIGRIIQFRVQPGVVTDLSYDPASGIPIRTGDQRIVRLVNPTTGTVAPGVTINKTRQLTLNEIDGLNGPLEALLNNTKWDGSNRPDFTAVTVGGMTSYYSELPNEGDTEVWEIVNLTADAHPIHTHLTQFQLLNRQKFNIGRYNRAYAAAFPGGAFIPGYGPPLDYNTGNPRALGGNPDITPYLQGPATPPPANEAGWKDTVTMLPGQVTRIVVRYAPQSLPVNDPDLYYPFDPNVLGHGYVWHCHIIDHEDNEMMRPLSVVPKNGAMRTYIQGVDY